METIIDLLKYSSATHTRVIIKPNDNNITVALIRKVGNLTFQEDVEIDKANIPQAIYDINTCVSRLHKNISDRK